MDGPLLPTPTPPPSNASRRGRRGGMAGGNVVVVAAVVVATGINSRDFTSDENCAALGGFHI